MQIKSCLSNKLSQKEHLPGCLHFVLNNLLSCTRSSPRTRQFLEISRASNQLGQEQRLVPGHAGAGTKSWAAMLGSYTDNSSAGINLSLKLMLEGWYQGMVQ